MSAWLSTFAFAVALRPCITEEVRVLTGVESTGGTADVDDRDTHVEAIATSELWTVRRLDGWTLNDIDCEQVHTSLVDWQQVRNEVRTFDEHWQVNTAPPVARCPKDPEESGWHNTSPIHVVLQFIDDAAVECPLGALAVAVLPLVCSSDCGRGKAAQVLQLLWHRLMSEETRAPYLLGTSSWPVASLMTKWSVNCTGRPLRAVADAQLGPPCGSSKASVFMSSMQMFARAHLLMLLVGGPHKQMFAEMRLGRFAELSLPLLDDLGRDVRYAPHMEWSLTETCSVEASVRNALLMLLRLLGPPVHTPIDPLSEPRTGQFSKLLGSTPIWALLRSGLPALALLAVSRFLTWRSHWLYPGSDVTPDRVRRALLHVGDALKSGSQPELLSGLKDRPGIIEALKQQPNVRRVLWQTVAAADSGFGGWWKRVARWLLQAPTNTPAMVFLTMAWGDLGDTWLQSFLRRAALVGLPRLVFMTPDVKWQLVCDEAVGRGPEVRSRLLCVRAFSKFARPYDTNNYAKFHLLPVFLSLGVDFAWLDVDIFLFRDPSARMISQAYRGVGKFVQDSPVDILCTDHFDETCLNHGVFFVKALDRTLIWSLHYIEWMHLYPFGHDQNGWDAFLSHSIDSEPMIPEEVRLNTLNITHSVLDTTLEYLTLTGWCGNDRDIPGAQLLHFTSTTPITAEQKKQRLLTMFNRTAPPRSLQLPAWGSGGGPGTAPPWGRHAVKRTLRELKAPAPPMWKRPCYEGIHMAVGDRVHDGTFWELFKYK